MIDKEVCYCCKLGPRQEELIILQLSNNFKLIHLSCALFIPDLKLSLEIIKAKKLELTYSNF